METALDQLTRVLIGAPINGSCLSTLVFSTASSFFASKMSVPQDFQIRLSRDKETGLILEASIFESYGTLPSLCLSLAILRLNSSPYEAFRMAQELQGRRSSPTQDRLSSLANTRLTRFFFSDRKEGSDR